MTVKTYSAFSYGHEITIDNNQLPFSENGVDELKAELRTGGYTLGDFSIEMARAMNEVGSLNYISTVDTLTGVITIVGDSNFWLYVTSSSLSSISAYDLLGFTVELSGSSSYSSDKRSGFLFAPQFYLQSYVDFEDNQKANSVTVSETATGKIQVTKYGDVKFMECNITLQTNIPQGRGSVIKNDTGETNLRLFMRYAVSKNPMEFYKDIESASLVECLLESTASDNNGTGFKLIELYTKGYADWYETGKLTFRELV